MPDLANRQGEARLVGGLLLSPDRITDVSLAVGAEDLFYEEYRYPYVAMCELNAAAKPVSVETIAAHLNRDVDGKNLLSAIGGRTTLASTLSGASPEEVDFWVEDVVKWRKRRDLQRTIDKYAVRIIDSENPDKLRAEIEESLVNLASPGSGGVSHVSNTTAELEARLNRYIEDPNAITGIHTNGVWDAWDRTLDGLRPGDVTIVYARTSRFKSQFVVNWALLLARCGYAGLVYPTEMRQLEYHERLVQVESGLNFRYLRRDGLIGNYREQIIEAEKRVSEMPIYFSDSFDLSVSSMASEIRRQRRWNGIEYVIVDLLDHVGTSKYGNDIIHQQEHIMKSIKSIARAEGVAIILVSHVAKPDKMDARALELPVEDMKGSSSKSQDVDAAICVVPATYGIPPEKRGRDADDYWYGLLRDEILAEMNTGGVNACITITKNRHGDTGRFFFFIDSANGGRFYLRN